MGTLEEDGMASLCLAGFLYEKGNGFRYCRGLFHLRMHMHQMGASHSIPSIGLDGMASLCLAGFLYVQGSGFRCCREVFV
jgi:hypothetical protein